MRYIEILKALKMNSDSVNKLVETAINEITGEEPTKDDVKKYPKLYEEKVKCDLTINMELLVLKRNIICGVQNINGFEIDTIITLLKRIHDRGYSSEGIILECTLKRDELMNDFESYLVHPYEFLQETIEKKIVIAKEFISKTIDEMPHFQKVAFSVENRKQLTKVGIVEGDFDGDQLAEYKLGDKLK